MAMYVCQRCRTVNYTTEPPHLCKDIARRLKRRERQVEEVLAILRADGCMANGPLRLTAEAIVARLANLGVEDD